MTGSAQATPARSGLRALPYSLRLWCEGLEEKFLERGAPAPLSVRLEGRLSPRPESGTRRAVAAPVRARKNKIQTRKLGPHDEPQRAVDCAPYLTLYASGVKDWRRNFWSAVLQHRFRFDWRDDFHVGQSLVQARPRWGVGLDEASPSDALFYCAVRTAFLWR